MSKRATRRHHKFRIRARTFRLIRTLEGEPPTPLCVAMRANNFKWCAKNHDAWRFEKDEKIWYLDQGYGSWLRYPGFSCKNPRRVESGKCKLTWQEIKGSLSAAIREFESE